MILKQCGRRVDSSGGGGLHTISAPSLVRLGRGDMGSQLPSPSPGSIAPPPPPITALPGFVLKWMTSVNKGAPWARAISQRHGLKEMFKKSNKNVQQQ